MGISNIKQIFLFLLHAISKANNNHWKQAWIASISSEESAFQHLLLEENMRLKKSNLEIIYKIIKYQYVFLGCSILNWFLMRNICLCQHIFFLIVSKIGIKNPSHYCIQLFYRMRAFYKKSSWTKREIGGDSIHFKSWETFQLVKIYDETMWQPEYYQILMTLSIFGKICLMILRFDHIKIVLGCFGVFWVWQRYCDVFLTVLIF